MVGKTYRNHQSKLMTGIRIFFITCLLFTLASRVAHAAFTRLPVTTKSPVITKTPSKPETPWLPTKHAVTNYSSPGTPLVANLYNDPSSSGKEIAYVDSDNKLYIYSSAGTELYHSPTAISVLPIRTGQIAPTAIDMYGQLDAQGNRVFGLLLYTTDPTATTNFRLSAFYLYNDPVTGRTMKRIDSPVMYPAGGITDQLTSPVVEDLDNDHKPEVFVTQVASNNISNFYAYTWDPTVNSIGGFTPLAYSKHPETSPLILSMPIMSGDGSNSRGFLNPVAGNITASGNMQVAVAIHDTGDNLTTFVFNKSGTTLVPVTNMTSDPYYWYQDPINEYPAGAIAGATVGQTMAGGLALVDLNGDSLLDIVASTKKVLTIPPGFTQTPYYAVRAYTALGGTSKPFYTRLLSLLRPTSQAAAIPKLEMPYGMIFDVSAPSIGTFETHPNALVFKSMGLSSGNNIHILMGAYYQNGSLHWITNYGDTIPRRINGNNMGANPPTCSYRSETDNSLITLADTNNTQTQEINYSKYYRYNAYFWINQMVAEGAPGTTDCGGTPFVTDPPQAYTDSSTKGDSTVSGIEFADTENTSTYYGYMSYFYIDSTYHYWNYLNQYAPTAGSLAPTEWGMTMGGPCRQGRQTAVCPTTVTTAVPTSTPTPMYTPTPTPSPTPAPPTNTPTLTPTPTPFVSCTGIFYFDANGNPITAAGMTAGSTIRVATSYTATNTTIDKARICINPGVGSCPVNTTWPETTLTMTYASTNYYYRTYTIPAATYAFDIKAEVHMTNGIWYP
jgi:hypothetical protein